MPARKTKIAPANRRVVPTIVCVNKATTKLGVNFSKLIEALQEFLDKHFVPVWGTPAKLEAAKRPRRGTWTLMFIDNADAAKRAKWLGYHHPDKTGLARLRRSS